ncbi:MAG TPA: hypothetical protein PKA77_15475 [Chitinophagaceae bacterium]|jgi:uncharacterized protein (UPF0305 family)|nr:hypothetical protein [Chitinophagaceae bacterium]HMU59575.1 hypothetical protein [Chitinophagaceae bacterium]
MTTKPAAAIIATSYTVPMDVFSDVLKIFLTHQTDYYIEGLNETENSLLIQVRTLKDDAVHKSVRRNISEILSDYGYFLKGIPGEYPETEQE